MSKYCIVGMMWATAAHIRVYKNNSSQIVSAETNTQWHSTWNQSDLLTLDATDTIEGKVTIKFKEACTVIGGSVNVQESTSLSITGSYAHDANAVFRPSSSSYATMIAYN